MSYNRPDGGPAFPQTPQLDLGKEGEITVKFTGVSVLDYFAAAALMGCTAAERLMPSKGFYESPVDAAKNAYDYAEAMVAERERRIKGGADGS